MIAKIKLNIKNSNQNIDRIIDIYKTSRIIMVKSSNIQWDVLLMNKDRARLKRRTMNIYRNMKDINLIVNSIDKAIDNPMKEQNSKERTILRLFRKSKKNCISSTKVKARIMKMRVATIITTPSNRKLMISTAK